MRKGVQWWNKPPVNGRELTATDVEYSFNRILGLGSGFTKRSTFVTDAQYNTIASITATDKYTVVFKWNTASLDNLYNLLGDFYVNSVVPHEVVEKYGDANNWQYFVGTGPWIIDDFVSGSSLSYSRNPNYFGYDERHPKNRLPYADKLKTLVIPDVATALSALRTGKIDLMEAIPWQQAKSISTTNPELIQATVPVQQSNSLDFRNDKEPFTDIRVRKALNMAIDRNAIAASYYGGTVAGTPFGLVGLKGYYTPFDQWPSDVKAGYTYNPAGARELLAAAGYPKGFKTNIVTSSTYDLDILQVIKSYFLDVGVDLEIKSMDNTSYTAFINARKHDQINATVSTAMLWEPTRCLTRRYSTHSSNSCFNNDPNYDKMVDKFTASFDSAERVKLVIDANDYALAEYWAVNLLPQVNYVIYQPWLKSYSGEDMTFSKGYLYARFWIDKD
jgi:peptide/nickel transport system substrate-binding protein